MKHQTISHWAFFFCTFLLLSSTVNSNQKTISNNKCLLTKIPSKICNLSILITFRLAMREFYYHFKTTRERERRRGRGNFLNFLRCSFSFCTHSQKIHKKKKNFSAFLHILNPSRILMNPAFSLKKIEGHLQLTDLQRVTHILQLQEYAVTIFSPSLSFEVEK